MSYPQRNRYQATETSSKSRPSLTAHYAVITTFDSPHTTCSSSWPSTPHRTGIVRCTTLNLSVRWRRRRLPPLWHMWGFPSWMCSSPPMKGRPCWVKSGLCVGWIWCYDKFESVNRSFSASPTYTHWLDEYYYGWWGVCAFLPMASSWCVSTGYLRWLIVCTIS